MNMIPDDKLSLLTAAVDDELSPAERRALKQLLGESAEARDLFDRLRADRDRLRALPQVPPPKDLPARIAAKLPVVMPRPIISPNRRTDRARPWVALTIAASVMLSVAGSSYWFFTRDSHRPGSAANPAQPDGTQTARGAGQGRSADVLPPPDGRLPSAPVVVDTPNNLAHDHPQPVERLDAIPAPRAVNRPLVGAPISPAPPPFELVQVRLPFLATVAELERDDVRRTLEGELGRDTLTRIDLFVKDSGRGAEAFMAAARASGVTVFADANAAERIKRRTPGAFAVYADSLTAAEVRDLLARLAAEDAKLTQKTFDSVHVNPSQPADQKELKDAFGIDPPAAKRGGPPEPKAISAGTGEAVAKSLSGSGPKPIEKPAALTTHGPANTRTPPALSKELKLFAEKRGDRKPNTVPVLILIRTAG